MNRRPPPPFVPPMGIFSSAELHRRRFEVMLAATEWLRSMTPTAIRGLISRALGPPFPAARQSKAAKYRRRVVLSDGAASHNSTIQSMINYQGLGAT